MRERGLGARVLRAFAAFSVGAALLFAGVGHAALPVIEDHVSEHLLGLETERVCEFVARHGELPAPSPFATAYVGAASLPPPLRGRVEGLGLGRHELTSKGRELWVSRSTVAGLREPLFVVFDVPDAPFSPWQGVIAGGALVLLLAGLLLGVALAGLVTRPLRGLAALVEGTPPDQLADALGGRSYEHEIQILVARLVASLRAMDASVVREQRFTRYASHELRSPVAVIQGACELLRLAPEAEALSVRRPVERIERATADMSAMIECFLWLARGPGEAEPGAEVRLGAVVARSIERHRRLLGDKHIEVYVEGDATAKAPASVLDIAVGNLIANAFQYTERGQVSVAISEQAILVTDTGPGMIVEPAEPPGLWVVRGKNRLGHGLGLSIVQSLCERLGWRLELRSEPGAGTRAELRFGPERPLGDSAAVG